MLDIIGVNAELLRRTLAFDHNLIIKEALTYIRQYIKFNPSSLFDLLPHKFTASQLRILYELVYGKQIAGRPGGPPP